MKIVVDIEEDRKNFIKLIEKYPPMLYDGNEMKPFKLEEETNESDIHNNKGVKKK